MKFGDTVYFIDGKNKGKKGRYLWRDYDSGYDVPHVFMDEDNFFGGWEAIKDHVETYPDNYRNEIRKPWDDLDKMRKAKQKRLRRAKKNQNNSKNYDH